MSTSRWLPATLRLSIIMAKELVYGAVDEPVPELPAMP